MAGYIGVDGKAKEVTDAYFGVGKKAKRVVRAFVGDENGKARMWYDKLISFHMLMPKEDNTADTPDQDYTTILCYASEGMKFSSWMFRSQYCPVKCNVLRNPEEGKTGLAKVYIGARYVWRDIPMSNDPNDNIVPGATYDFRTQENWYIPTQSGVSEP